MQDGDTGSVPASPLILWWTKSYAGGQNPMHAPAGPEEHSLLSTRSRSSQQARGPLPIGSFQGVPRMLFYMHVGHACYMHEPGTAARIWTCDVWWAARVGAAHIWNIVWCICLYTNSRSVHAVGSRGKSCSEFLQACAQSVHSALALFNLPQLHMHVQVSSHLLLLHRDPNRFNLYRAAAPFHVPYTMAYVHPVFSFFSFWHTPKKQRRHLLADVLRVEPHQTVS